MGKQGGKRSERNLNREEKKKKKAEKSRNKHGREKRSVGGVVRSDSVKSKHRKTARERGSGRRREQHEE